MSGYVAHENISNHHDTENGVFQETEEQLLRKAALEEALSYLDEDSLCQVLLQAIKHFPTVKKYRDQLIVRIGELDKTFGEWVIKTAEEEKITKNLKQK
ncbi:unnamed protein product [Blepharisma stoltei]|uniref:Uncharacterized protein n=1 Tax=Blepharisma stoltei TaxID=1481888 RepID=A0AAU9IJW6_9CILI|nr:unnamed protein product [Blepharisma stoltei]